MRIVSKVFGFETSKPSPMEDSEHHCQHRLTKTLAYLSIKLDFGSVSSFVVWLKKTYFASYSYIDKLKLHFYSQGSKA